jgi:SAM-dependent methyltransferase
MEGQRPRRHVATSELLVGVEGLALLRHLYDGGDEQAAARLAEVRAIVGAATSEPAAEPIAEAAPRDGYAVWAACYDEPGNPIVELEQPTVWSMLADLPAGRALDAACGTGRHAAELQRAGHEVDGFDLTPEMLAIARAAVPGARFAEGELLAVPFDDGSFDVVVCGLALAHVARMPDAIAELARVLAPGGRVVLSVLHPFLAALGWHAPFQDADGRRGFVREHDHMHADYLAALRAAGLRLEDLAEPRLKRRQVAAKRRAMREIPEATVAAYVGLPGVLVLAASKP